MSACDSSGWGKIKGLGIPCPHGGCCSCRCTPSSLDQPSKWWTV